MLIIVLIFLNHSHIRNILEISLYKRFAWLIFNYKLFYILILIFFVIENSISR